ncbi:MAG: integrase [Ignisphaera sp.]
MNPRRPMPAGLKPLKEAEAVENAEEAFYHSNGGAEEKPISGKSGGLVITGGLLDEFREWLRYQGTSEKTVKNYISILKRFSGVVHTANDFFADVGLSKKSYEAFSRFLTFLARAKNMEDVAGMIRKTMPRKPRSGVDTRVPSDEEVLRLRESIAATGNALLTTIYSILVGSGCRLSEAYLLIKSFREDKLVCISKDFCRYHLDLSRGYKNVYVLYLPAAVVGYVRSVRDLHIPHINSIAKAFERLGLGAKYLRKWFRQTCKKLRIDSEVIEFLQGRVTGLGVGAKHYTDLVALADEEYPKILDKIRSFLIEM